MDEGRQIIWINKKKKGKGRRGKGAKGGQNTKQIKALNIDWKLWEIAAAMTIDKAKQYTPKHLHRALPPATPPCLAPPSPCGHGPSCAQCEWCVWRANNKIDLQNFVKLELAAKIAWQRQHDWAEEIERRGEEEMGREGKREYCCPVGLAG